MQITTIGMDIAKQVFHIVGLNQANREVMKKKLRRQQVLPFFANLSDSCVIAMEACASSNYWGRELEKLGHEVRLIPPRYVKPFVQGNKNDVSIHSLLANQSLLMGNIRKRPEVPQFPLPPGEG